MLTGREIARQVELGRIRIDPFDPAQLRANSYEYRLGDTFRKLLCNAREGELEYLDPRLEMCFQDIPLAASGQLLKVEDAYLGSTYERFGSDFYAALVTGSEAVGNMFVKNHACAGLIDQGFFNFITLEITVKLPTLLYPGMPFGQIFWFESKGECNLYQGKYALGSNAAAPSKISTDIES